MKVMTATRYNRMMVKKTGKKPKVISRSTFETIPALVIKKKGPVPFGQTFTRIKELDAA